MRERGLARPRIAFWLVGVDECLADGESREQRQLHLIEEFGLLAAEAGVDCWLRGGWALDFLLGCVTSHTTTSTAFVWAADLPKFLPHLERHGYKNVGGPPPAQQQRNLVKNGEELHVTLLARTELGVVTAGGRWDGRPWPEGMLEGPICRLGGIRCRVISADAQLYAKTEVPHALSHARRERDDADIALLRQLLGNPAK